jgi:GTPase SAR1 family protein
MTLSADNTESLFEIYERRREELLAIARRQREVLVTLGIDETQAEGTKPGALVEDLIKRLESERLRVLVIGRFNAGKSTFINALLGEAALPAAPVPTTGVLCEIRYADESHKKAMLFPKPGMGPDGGSEPFEVKVNDLRKELAQYVKIDYRDDQATSRYQKLELYWPLPLCEHGVDLIDSVGLDDPDSRDHITMDQTSTADAILYCMKSIDTYSAKDKQVISFLQSLGYRSIFFIITYWDHIKESATQGQMTEEEFVREQRHNLAPWTELHNDGIKFVDSKSALLGRIEGNRAKIAASGIEDVESSLQHFLTQEKGRAKLLTSLRALRSTNRAARTTVPTRINLWQTSATELDRRYREAEVPLQSLETQRQLIVANVDVAFNDVAREARDIAGRHLLELPDRIKSWAESYEIQTSPRFPTTRKNIQPLVEEVMQRLKEQIEEDIARWTQIELAPMVATRVQQVRDSLEERARDFIQKVDQLRVQIAIGEDAANSKQRDVSILGSVLAGAYTVVTLDFLTAGLLGGKAMITTVAIQFASSVALYALGIVNPLALIAATAATIWASGVINISALKRRIKRQAGEDLSTDIITRRQDMATMIEDKVTGRLGEIRNAIDAGLRGEIASLRGEVEMVLAAQQRGQADAAAEILALQSIEKKNLAIEEQIDALMYEAGIAS